MAGTPAFTGCFYVHPAKGVDTIHAELADAIPAEWGVEVRPWGARELTLRDPDGYFITLPSRRHS